MVRIHRISITRERWGSIYYEGRLREVQTLLMVQDGETTSTKAAMMEDKIMKGC